MPYISTVYLLFKGEDFANTSSEEVLNEFIYTGSSGCSLNGNDLSIRMLNKAVSFEVSQQMLQGNVVLVLDTEDRDFKCHVANLTLDIVMGSIFRSCKKVPNLTIVGVETINPIAIKTEDLLMKSIEELIELDYVVYVDGKFVSRRG